TGGQSLAWSRGAIAESSANTLALNLAALGCFPKELGIGEHHPAEPHEVNPPLAHRSLRHVREEILQVGIRRSNHQQVWEPLLELTSHCHLSCNSHQWIFRRQISVRRWVQRWSLDMRIVVRATSRDVHQLNAQLL